MEGSRLDSWIALRAAGPPAEGGTITLPETTIAINNYCFAQLDCAFTINWEELPRLVHIYDSAFAQSGLTGVIHPVQSTYMMRIRNDAFYQTNIVEADFSDVSLRITVSRHWRTANSCKAFRLMGVPEKRR